MNIRLVFVQFNKGIYNVFMVIFYSPMAPRHFRKLITKNDSF